MLDAQTGAILLLSDNELEVVASHSSGANIERPLETRYHIDDCVSGFAVKKKDVINVRDVHQEKPYNTVYQSLGPDMNSNIVAPLVVDEKVTGVLSFESKNKFAFASDDEELLKRTCPAGLYGH